MMRISVDFPGAVRADDAEDLARRISNETSSTTRRSGSDGLWPLRRHGCSSFPKSRPPPNVFATPVAFSGSASISISVSPSRSAHVSTLEPQVRFKSTAGEGRSRARKKPTTAVFAVGGGARAGESAVKSMLELHGGRTHPTQAQATIPGGAHPAEDVAAVHVRHSSKLSLLSRDDTRAARRLSIRDGGGGRSAPATPRRQARRG